MQAVMDWVQQLKLQEWIGLLFTALIPIYATLDFFFRLRRSSRRLVRELEEATAIVQRYSKTTHDFHDNYLEIDTEMCKLPDLEHNWREFTEILIFPTEPQGSIQNTRDCTEYFDAEVLAAGRLNWRLNTALPGYLTGAGIMGTFIGLVFALTGLDTQSAEVFMQTADKVLGGAWFAFLTSIAGLLSSITYSFCEKRQYGAIRNSSERLSLELEKRLDRTTPDAILVKILEEQKQQTRTLANAVGGLGTQVADVLARELSGSIKKHLDAVGEDLKMLRAAIDAAAGRLETTSRNLVRNIEEGAANLGEIFNEGSQQIVESSREAVEQGVRGITNSLEQLKAHIDELAASLANVDSIESSVDRQKQILLEWASTLEEAKSRLGSLASEMGGVGTRIQESSAHLHTLLADAASVSRELAKASERMSGTSAQLERTTSAHGGRLEKVDRHLTEIFAGIQRYHMETAKMLQSFAEESDRHLAKALDSLGGHMSAVDESVLPLRQATDRLSGLMEQMNRADGDGELP